MRLGTDKHDLVGCGRGRLISRSRPGDHEMWVSLSKTIVQPSRHVPKNTPQRWDPTHPRTACCSLRRGEEGEGWRGGCIVSISEHRKHFDQSKLVRSIPVETPSPSSIRPRHTVLVVPRSPFGPAAGSSSRSDGMPESTFSADLALAPCHVRLISHRAARLHHSKCREAEASSGRMGEARPTGIFLRSQLHYLEGRCPFPPSVMRTVHQAIPLRHSRGNRSDDDQKMTGPHIKSPDG
jgi:hypothetical protein